MATRNIWPILLRTLFKGTRREALTENTPINLPTDVIFQDNVRPDRQSVNAYHAFHNWHSHRKSVHPCYLHSLGFANSVKLMLNRDFAFSPLGLVHTLNRIQQFQPVLVDDCLQMKSAFSHAYVTEKGWHFTIETELQRTGDIVWKGTAEYLKRLKASPGKKLSDAHPCLTPVLEHQSESLHFAGDCGRAFARLSGDYNPIHWAAFSAKLLGFKRHIAHGMHSKALCMSALLQSEFAPFDCQVAFKKPVYLPAQTKFCQRAKNNNLDFWLLSQDARELHLSGQMAR